MLVSGKSFLAGIVLCVMAHFKIQSQPLHEYFFNNNLQGTLGAPPLTEIVGCGAPVGRFSSGIMITSEGICSGSEIFCFNQGAGLEYHNPASFTDEYTIQLFCKFNNTMGRFRLIDFSAGTSDAGMYMDNNCLSIASTASAATCPFLFSPNQFYLFSIVRTTNNIVKVYVDGNLFKTFNDASKMYTLSTNTTSVILFKDDSIVPCEAKAGGIKYACFTSHPMIPVDIFNTWSNICGKILNASPDPSTVSEKGSFYPNPADKSIIIDDKRSYDKVSLKNVLGEEIGVLQNGKLNTEQVPEGLYFLSIDTKSFPVIIKH